MTDNTLILTYEQSKFALFWLNCYHEHVRKLIESAEGDGYAPSLMKIKIIQPFGNQNIGNGLIITGKI